MKSWEFASCRTDWPLTPSATRTKHLALLFCCQVTNERHQSWTPIPFPKGKAARRRSNSLKFYFRSAHRTSNILPSCGGKAACTASGSGNVRLMAQTSWRPSFGHLNVENPVELGRWKSGKELEFLGPDFDIVGWTSGEGSPQFCYLISTRHLHKQLQQLQ